LLLQDECLSPLLNFKLSFDFDFSTLAIKGRGVQGNILSKYLVKTIKLKQKGVSTLGGIDIWFDWAIGRLNVNEHGTYLGNFSGEDLILSVYKDGNYELTNFDLSNHFDYEQLLLIVKFRADRAISCVYFDGKAKQNYLKRFLIETQTLNKKFLFISEEKGSYVVFVSDQKEPKVNLVVGKGKNTSEEEIVLSELIEVKGWKSIGNKFTTKDLVKIELISTEELIEESIAADDNETNLTEDLFKEEEEKIKKLLADDEDVFDKKKSPAKKPNPDANPDQPKLF
jgi:topoisomerase-4 subunit A